MSLSTSAYSFDDKKTHPDITTRAIDASKLDATLKMTLGMIAGIDTMLTPTTGSPRVLSDWLTKGSTDEDDPACRASNHFHNPLKDFGAAGVTDQPPPLRAYCALQGYGQIWSNVSWGTKFTAPTQWDANLATHNDMDWDAARTAYFTALSDPSPDRRKAALAQTFQILGQVLHLLQDLAVPAHVRDDFMSHLEYFAPGFTDPTRWWSNDFERFVKGHSGLITAGVSLPPSLSANQSVTQFWDTGKYQQTRALPADLAQGLAEYTNAYFASQNTIFTEFLSPDDPRYFPHPSREDTTLPDLLNQRQLPLQVIAEDGIPDTTLYVYRKSSLGVVADPYRIAKAGFFHRPVLAKESLFPTLVGLGFQLDDTVMADYATRLLPRAVAYSAGLLDYFFRGKLNFTVSPRVEDPALRQLTITNTSAEAMQGTFSLYAEDGDGGRAVIPTATWVTGESSSLAAGATSLPIVFTPLENFPVAGYALVFQGKVGAEERAVAGAVNPVAVVYAIQETAGFTDNPTQTDTGNVASGSGYSQGVGRQMGTTPDPTKQRATGHFETGGTQAPGKFIKAVRLERAVAPAPGTNPAVLWLENQLHEKLRAENEWIRGEDSALFEPSTWAIEIDLSDVGLNGPQVSCGPYGEYTCSSVRLPRAIEVEMLDGSKMKTPLVWWLGATAEASVGAGCNIDIPAAYYIRRSTSQAEHGQGVAIFYGDGDPGGSDYRWVAGEYPDFQRAPYPLNDAGFPHTSVGFVPASGLGGFGVTAIVDEQSNSTSGESWTMKSAHVFAHLYGEVPMWAKNSADAGETTREGTMEYVDLPQGQGEPFCVMPSLPEIDLPAIPDLQFTRDYLPQEVTAFQALGITPPPHSITLKARVTP